MLAHLFSFSNVCFDRLSYLLSFFFGAGGRINVHMYWRLYHRLGELSAMVIYIYILTLVHFLFIWFFFFFLVVFWNPPFPFPLRLRGFELLFFLSFAVAITALASLIDRMIESHAYIFFFPPSQRTDVLHIFVREALRSRCSYTIYSSEIEVHSNE